MSEFTRELIPVLFMYGVVLLLAPFIGLSMWAVLKGDRAREAAAAARIASSSKDA